MKSTALCFDKRCFFAAEWCLIICFLLFLYKILQKVLRAFLHNDIIQTQYYWLGGMKMRACPKCGELNGDNNTHCFKCGVFISSQENYKKICPKCGIIYSAKAEECEDCHCTLMVYNDSAAVSAEESRSETWPYIIAVLFTTIGLIIGLIFIAQKREEGPSVLITSLVASVVWGILFFMLASCSA